MNNIYNYFLTDKLLCKNENIITNNFFLGSHRYNKSILKKYYTNINKLKNNNVNTNYDPNTDEIILKLNDIYNDFLKNKDINNFCNKLNGLKNKLLNSNNHNLNIKKFYLNNNFKDKIIINPISLKIINSFITNTNNIFKNNKYQIHNQIDILSQGKFINFDYPTLGIIENKLSITTYPDKYSDIKTFFNDILDNIYNMNNEFKLPIQQLNLGEDLCNLLNNNNLEGLIHFVTFTRSSIKEIFLEDYGKKGKKIIKSKYIIPYSFVIDGSMFKIIKIPPKKLFKYIKNLDFYIDYEKKLFNNTIHYIEYFFLGHYNDINFLNDCYKIIYLFSYRNINIFYDLYINFIDKINSYVLSLKISNNKVFKNLNYKNYFEYITKLNKSLLKTKTIMLNNLYKYYKPNNIGKNYGIIYDNEDIDIALIDKNIYFMNSILDIYEKLFFTYNYKGKVDLTFFTEFDNNDFYDIENKLFIGVNYRLNNYLKTTLGLITFNDIKEKSYNKVNIKIIDYIIKIFNNCIPIELLKELEDKNNYLISTTLNEKEINLIENFLINLFEKYLNNSINSLIKMGNKKDDKNLLLISKINYNISYFIYEICFTNINNIKLKNNVINRINQIKDLKKKKLYKLKKNKII